MSDKKRLSHADVEQIKKMVLSGTAPEDIANHYGIAISSVHYYKSKFKSEGLNFPSVRGRRPSGSVDTPVTQHKPIGQINSATQNVEGDGYKFIVNGTSVQISGHAKNVNIGKDSMEINF